MTKGLKLYYVKESDIKFNYNANVWRLLNEREINVALEFFDFLYNK